MRDPTVSVTPHYACEYEAHAACWLIRLSLHLESCLSLILSSEYADATQRLLQLNSPKHAFTHKTMRSALQQRLAQFDSQPQLRQSELFVNTQLLGQLLQLNEVEQRIVEFVTLSSGHPLLSNAIDAAHLKRTDDVILMLSVVLTCDRQAVRAALDQNGTLMQTTLLHYERTNYDSTVALHGSEFLTDIVHRTHTDVNDLISYFIEPACASALTINDFPHLVDEIELLTAYLNSVTQTAHIGANVLIYGQPGVGKTELVKLLAQRVGTSLYQVKSSQQNEQIIGGHARLLSFTLSQRILGQTNALILFDEMDDMFVSTSQQNMTRRGRNSTISKAWINKLLESNAVPTIWVANDLSDLDPAYLRRFDFSIEMGVPPIAVRKRLIKKHLRGLRIAPAVINHYAQHEALSPAQIEKAAKVSRLIVDQGIDSNKTFKRVLKHSMELFQQSAVPTQLDAKAHYRLDYLNADCDLHRLVEQLAQADKPQGALCFFGAPGTGKSAFAYHLSQTSERPLLVRRASDILSPYVGEAEQNIAEMFKQAEQAEAILLLDEADSLLSDRKRARASWEVTQVNEMLTQMESFKGLFICSTNLMTQLDEASLRRFAIKIRFDYLKPEQRWQLYREHIGRRVKVDEAHSRAVLNRLNNLTPGDFACIRRQAALLNENLTPERWLFHLERECRAKPDQGSRSIGFV